ncbi:hypothetical protein C0992_004025 [Termitomyces sp. T32_za158]|nr:hypothetical protein C0992_004025 [Termitomyces sp. T32_za158]
MSAAPSDLSSGSARIVLPPSGPLKSSQVLTKIQEFEGRLELVENKLPTIQETNELVVDVKEWMKRAERQEKDIEFLKKENVLLKAEIKARAIINDVTTTDDETSANESDSEEELTKMEEEIEGSSLAYADNAFKELTRYAFNHNMGVGKFSEDDPPPYPDSNERETWPRIPGTDDPVIRFRWDKPWNHKDNYDSPALLRISDDDHQRRVRERFANLQKKIKEAQRCRKTKDVGPGIEMTQGDGGFEEDGAVNNVAKEKKTLSAATLRSRAAGKLAFRLAQREKLPKDSPYRSSKYDSAFVVSLMSDDEDEYDENGKPTNRFISRAPLYRSQEMIDLLAAVDTVRIDIPKRYTIRVRGEPVDIPPKKSAKVEFRARRWMVDEAWLAQEKNQQWDKESCIIESGKAWGDEEDPETIAARREEVKLTKKAIATEKKRKMLEIGIGREMKKAKKPKKTKKTKMGKGKVHAKEAFKGLPAPSDGDDDELMYD